MKNEILGNILTGVAREIEAAEANRTELNVQPAALGFDTESADIDAMNTAIANALAYDFESLGSTNIKIPTNVEMLSQTSLIGMDAKAALADIESFDGIEPKITKKLTIATNVAGINDQDPVFELLFPTIQLGATEGGLEIREEVYSVFDGVENEKGKPSGYKGKTNIIDLFRTGLNYGDKNKLQPLWDADYADYLIEDLKANGTAGGEDAIIAPIKAGVIAPLLDLSLTKQMKEDSDVSYTDGISPFITIDQVALKGVKDDKQGYVVVSNKNDLASVATPKVGDTKSYTLSLSSTTVLSASTVVKGSSIADLAPELVAGGELEGYTIEFKTNMSGEGNLVANEDGSVITPMSLTGLNKEIVAVIDENGVRVLDTSSAAYVKAKEVVARFEFAGYVPTVRLTMQNIRVNNIKTTYDQKAIFVDVPYLSGVEAPEPLLFTSSESDAAKLNTLLHGHALLTSTLANDFINEMIAELKVRGLGADTRGLTALSRTYKQVGFKSEVFNPSMVDAENTTDKLEGINAGFSQQLSRAITSVVTLTNFINAKKSVTGSDALEFLVVVGSDLKDVITDVTVPDAKIKMVYKDHVDYHGRVKVFPVNLSGAKSGKAIDPASFGNRITRPTLTATFSTNAGRKNEKVTASFPSMRYIMNIPFVIEYKVEGVESFIKNKVPAVRV